MSFTIGDLIQGNQILITVKPADSIQLALDLMVEHNYSQLPVVDDGGRPLGVVTSDSILHALGNFGITVAELQVAEAIVKADMRSPDEDLFDLLDDLQDTYAVLVVDENDELIGIVTSYDTTNYFRRRAEDMMLLEDIEGALKDHVLFSFIDKKTGGINRLALESALKESGNSERMSRGRFQQALRRYLELSGIQDVEPNKAWVSDAFTRLTEKEASKTIDDLTLNQYIDLLLHKSRWDNYGTFIFGLEPSAIRRLLENVRDTRNILAHFRGEVSAKQRIQLRFCKDWLNRHPVRIPESFLTSLSNQLSDQSALKSNNDGPGSQASPVDDRIVPLDETAGSLKSRYAALARHLQNQSLTTDRVSLTFKEIEQIISGDLPDSARQHRSWWANDSVGHVQSQQWLDAGWRISFINLPQEEVIFSRAGERQRLYIEFFNDLLRDFRQVASFQVKEHSPQGQSWYAVAGLPVMGPQLAILAFSFAQGSRFRVELYIDTGDKERNKHVFDQLLNLRAEIEAEIGDALSWERIDDKRASRIALYHSGSITAKSEELASLHKWAVAAMLRFQKTIGEKANQALMTEQTALPSNELE